MDNKLLFRTDNQESELLVERIQTVNSMLKFFMVTLLN